MAGVSDLVRLSHGPCAQWTPDRPPTMVVTNPPWGHRLSDSGSEDDGAAASLESAWKDLGRFLKVLSVLPALQIARPACVACR